MTRLDSRAIAIFAAMLEIKGHGASTSLPGLQKDNRIFMAFIQIACGCPCFFGLLFFVFSSARCQTIIESFVERFPGSFGLDHADSVTCIHGIRWWLYCQVTRTPQLRRIGFRGVPLALSKRRDGKFTIHNGPGPQLRGFVFLSLFDHLP